MRERLDRRNRLLHPAEDDPGAFALELHGDDPAAGLEPDHLELERAAEDERRPERRVARERHLDSRREDANPRVGDVAPGIDEHRLAEVHFSGQGLKQLLRKLACVSEDR